MKTYNITIKPTGTITVTPASLVLPNTGTTTTIHNIDVSCSNDLLEWTLETTSDWFEIGLNSDGTGKGKKVTGTGSETVYTFASPNTGTSNLTTTVTLDGATNVVVRVTQLYPNSTNTVLANFYVGAFWRAGETGERIIRKEDNTTPWVVSVLWMDDNWADDDILLAPGLHSTFADFDAVNNDQKDVELYYQVVPMESKPSLSGEDKIEFRVGLKTRWSANPKYNAITAPARYAVLVLSYGTSYGSKQKIFLRQGHEADYVMRMTGDPGENITAGARPKAVKFSPYNLTHPEIKAGTSTGGTTIASHPFVPERSSLTADDAPDYFTAYPSQAGAFFMWANDRVPRVAVQPTDPTGEISDWPNNYFTPYWDALGDAYETCPPGWRRPNDGSTSEANNVGAVTDSEMRQSLWLNPQVGIDYTGSNLNNSIWGYYADGYFDRRAIEDGLSSNSGLSSVVSFTSSTPAYKGRLFFNPTTNASLFIPAAGYRTRYNLMGEGAHGFYYSSSAFNFDRGLNLRFYNTEAYQGQEHLRSTGMMVRCVSE